MTTLSSYRSNIQLQFNENNSVRSGVIAYRYDEDGQLQILMVKHKHTFTWNCIIFSIGIDLTVNHMKSLNEEEYNIMKDLTVEKFKELTKQDELLYGASKEYRTYKHSEKELEEFVDEIRYICSQRNIPYREKWTFPKGCIENNETLKQAAKREFFEETGIIIPLDVLDKKIVHYHGDTEMNYWLVNAGDNNLNIDENIHFNTEEVSSVKWITLDFGIDRMLTMRDSKILFLFLNSVEDSSKTKTKKTKEYLHTAGYVNLKQKDVSIKNIFNALKHA